MVDSRKGKVRNIGEMLSNCKAVCFLYVLVDCGVEMKSFGLLVSLGSRSFISPEIIFCTFALVVH